MFFPFRYRLNTLTSSYHSYHIRICFLTVLVALVTACETRDLLPVIECVFKRNAARQEAAPARQTNSIARNNSSSNNDASFESAYYAGNNTSFSAWTATSEASSFGPASSSSLQVLDPYRTILYYLARYQCTTAFHAFFPTTVARACKGYHFWCA